MYIENKYKFKGNSLSIDEKRKYIIRSQHSESKQNKQQLMLLFTMRVTQYRIQASFHSILQNLYLQDKNNPQMSNLYKS